MLVSLLNFGVILFVLFAEPAHSGMLVGMWRWLSAWVRFHRAKKLAKAIRSAHQQPARPSPFIV
jgi:hypothetical protein